MPGRRDDVGHRRVDGGRVERVVAGDHRVQQRGVEHGARAGAGLVERGGEARPGRSGDTPPYVGLTPTVPVTAAGWRIEPPVSVPIGQRRLEGGDRRGRAAAGAAGDAGRGPTGCAVGP